MIFIKWDVVYDKLVNYIKFASKQVSEQYQMSGMYSAEDLFQEGQLILFECFKKYKHKPENEFYALFKSSMWRRMRDLGAKKTLNQVDIEDAYDLGYTDTVVEDLYTEYKLQHLASMLEDNPLALTILKEFVNPSKRTVWEAKMDIARKSMLKEQNYSVAVPKTIEIKSSHIQRAMEITKVEFNKALKVVKECLSREYQIGTENLQLVV